MPKPKRVPQRRNKIKPKGKRKKGTTKATGRSYEYQRTYNARPSERKRRAELNKYNREAGTYGNGDGKDASHKDGKIVGFEKQSANRSRNGKGSVKRRKK